MSYHDDLITERTAKATTQIVNRYGVDPESIKWQGNVEGACCLFRSKAAGGGEYLASVGFDKNVVRVFQYTRRIALN